MRKGLVLLIAILSTFLAAGTASADTLPPGWTTVTGSSDFSGTTLDSPHWVAYDGTNPASGEVWNPAECVVGGGYLTLNANSAGLCGVTSTVEHTYGKFAIRAKFNVPAGAGYAPVFLFWPENDSDWPAAGEIDVVECYDLSRMSYQSWNHYADANGNNQSDYAGTENVNMTAWNVYAWDWEPGFIKEYVNGVLWHTYTTHIESGPMHMVMQIDQISAASGSTSVNVDWFRSYA